MELTRDVLLKIRLEVVNEQFRLEGEARALDNLMGLLEQEDAEKQD